MINIKEPFIKKEKSTIDNSSTNPGHKWTKIECFIRLSSSHFQIKRLCAVAVRYECLSR